MKRICAWCKRGLGTISSELHAEDIITHGICDECQKKLLGPQKVAWLEFLDSLNMPVVVIDATVHVATANKSARILLQKDLPEIEGILGGVVFECAYSLLPEGCGNTVHCSGCTIRNTVMDTFKTGSSHLKVQVSLTHGTPDNNQEIFFLISTEKVMDAVLLRIDTAGND